MAHMMWIGGVDKIGWLLAVDSLSKLSVKESVLDVRLVDWPGVGGGKAENNSDGGRFDNRAKCLSIVNTGLLSESTHNPTSFVSCQCTI